MKREHARTSKQHGPTAPLRGVQGIGGGDVPVAGASIAPVALSRGLWCGAE